MSCQITPHFPPIAAGHTQAPLGNSLQKLEDQIASFEANLHWKRNLGFPLPIGTIPRDFKPQSQLPLTLFLSQRLWHSPPRIREKEREREREREIKRNQAKLCEETPLKFGFS